jgi:hypothetical protein
MDMKTIVHSLLVLVMLIVVAAPVYPADPAAYEVVQIWACEMEEGATEDQVEAMAQQWLKAMRQLPGGAGAKLGVFFPVAVNHKGQIDFHFVLSMPSFTDWGKMQDAYTEDSPAAKVEDLFKGKVVCPDSMLWEAHTVQAN